MVAAPTTAIDLPLKALVWQDAEGAWGAPGGMVKRLGRSAMTAD